jgi:hypothetical protein
VSAGTIVEEGNRLPPSQTHHALSHTAAQVGGTGAWGTVGPHTWGGRSNQDTTDLSPDGLVHSLSVDDRQFVYEMLEKAMTTPLEDLIRWAANDSPAPEEEMPRELERDPFDMDEMG